MRESTIRRIEKLKNSLEKLKKYSEMEIGEILLKPEICDSIERSLQVCVEALADISRKIISNLNWRIPLSYKDVFKVLHENGVIDSKLLSRLEELAGIRNIIVHFYTEVDIKKIYENLEIYMTTIETALQTLLNFCRKNNIDP